MWRGKAGGFPAIPSTEIIVLKFYGQVLTKKDARKTIFAPGNLPNSLRFFGADK